MLFLKKTGFLILTSFAILANWSIVLGEVWSENLGGNPRVFKNTMRIDGVFPYNSSFVMKKGQDKVYLQVNSGDWLTNVDIEVRYNLNDESMLSDNWTNWVQVSSNIGLASQSWSEAYSVQLDVPSYWNVDKKYKMEFSVDADFTTAGGQQGSMNNLLSEVTIDVVPSADKFFEDNIGNNLTLWKGGSQFDIPFIFVMGFDPTNKTSSQQFYNSRKDDLIKEVRNADPNIDILIYDYADGGTSLLNNRDHLINGLSFLNTIINSPKAIWGYSMGGVITRAALAKAEEENLNLNISYFISLDSPQRGANANLDLQNLVDEFPCLDDDLIFSIGEFFVGDIDFDILDELGLNSIAARQLLKIHFDDLLTPPSEHTSVYNTINSTNGNGYPTNSINIGASFGNWTPNINAPNLWLEFQEANTCLDDKNIYLTLEDGKAGSLLPIKAPYSISKGFSKFGISYTVDLEIFHQPTFISTESALDQNSPNSSSGFDFTVTADFNHLHNEFPNKVIKDILKIMGYLPVANWAVTPNTQNYTNSGSWINYSGAFQVQFQDLSTQQNGTITNWLWDFGDGTTSTQQNPTHTYQSYGKHNVKLTVTNSAGVQSENSYGILAGTSQEVNGFYIYPGIPSITGDLFVESAPGFCQLEPKSWKATQNTNDLSINGTMKWKIEKGSKSYFVEGNINSLGKNYLSTNPSFGSFSWNSHIGGDCQAFKLSAQKKANNAESSWKEFANGTPIVKLNCDCNLNPGPNDPVCPHIVLNINGQEVVENNILYFSNEQREFGPVTDKCLIQNELPIENGKYVLNIEEIGTSISNLDYFSLETIDVPTGIEVGALAQENQELVFFYPDSLNSVLSADVNGTQDIRSEIINNDSQFFLSDSGDVLNFVVNPVSNETCKIIIKTLELDPTIEAQPKYVYGFSVIGGGEEENIASIAYRNKDYTHVLDVSDFVSSENQTTFKLSFRNKVSIDQIAIDTTPIDLNEIQVNQVELSNAELILGGESGVINQLSELSSPDFDYSWLKPNQSLKLEFSVPTQESGTQRKFVLASQGFYVTPSDSISLEVSIPEGFNLFSMPVDSVKQNSNYQELFTNNTNTYFPYTTINYEEVDWTLTDSVFFQQGFSTVAEGSPKTLNFTGKEKLEYDLNLSEGWNLIPSISNEVSIAKYFSSNGGPFREGFYYDYGYKAIDTDNAILKPGDAIWVYVDSPIEILNFPYGDSSEPLTKSTSDSLIYLNHNQLLGLNGLIEFSIISAQSDTVKLFLAQSDSFSVDNSYFGKPPLPESNLVDSLKFFDAQIYFNDSTYTYANVQDSSNVNLTLRLTAANSKYPISISWTDALGNLQVTTVDSSSLTKPVNLNRSSGKVAMKVSSEQNFINIAGTLKNYKNTLPSKYSLSQNYPNPFNPSTRINYSIPENSFVKLEVFNILGRKVKTLVSNVQKSGNYSVKWNGLNDENKLVSSGVYFYRIESGDFVSIKKMLLLK